MRILIDGNTSSPLNMASVRLGGLIWVLTGLLFQDVSAAARTTVTPSSVTLTASQTQQFTVAVTGGSSPITWSLQPPIGTISATGLYSAPTAISSQQTVTVTANTGPGNKSDTATVTLAPGSATPIVNVSVTPLTVSLAASQTQQFTATVTGSTNTAVTWSLNPAVGTLSAGGKYTAPTTISSAQTVTVTATSAADSTKSASSSVTLTPPVTITMTPSTASLTASKTQQFTATVSGTGNTAVTWLVNPAVGTISSTGLYTAPASISSAQTVTVKATSAADTTKSASSSVTLTPPVTISMTPSTVSLTASQTQQFTATVTGTGNTAVTWSVNPAVGTISTTGLYTAPASISSAQTVTVKATSAADSTKSASSSVTLSPPVTISMTPAVVSVTPSQVQSFSAAVSGTTNTGVKWTLSPSVGSLSTSGDTAVYTAPASITSSQTAQVSAVSMADSTKTANSLVTLVPMILVSLAPTSVSLTAGQSQQFTASVSGTTNQAVTWSVQPAVGSISSTGLYTAPTTVLTSQNVTVTAQSAEDPTKSTSSTVTLQTTPQLQWSIDANRLTSLSYGGQSFFQYVNSIVQGAVFRAPNGTTTDAGWSNPSKSTLYSNPTAFEEVYNQGQPYQFTLRVTWIQTDNRTLKAVAQVINNDPTNTLVSLSLHILSVNLPGPATQYNQNQPLEVNQYNGVPATFLSGTWGSIALWQSGYPTPARQISYYNSATQTAFDNILNTSTPYGPRTYSLETPPGQTSTMTQYIRFGSTSETAATLASDAYSEYRTAFPNQIDWPDRRPIATWFISDGAKRSATNPRGYLADSTIDISNTSNFQSRVLTSADNTISVLNGMTVRPQGIIIWDLEGQEFDHAFTYVGYPNQLPFLAPEMDSVADALMTKVRAAGYKVGVTIRPNHFSTGNNLPSTCIADSNYALADKYVMLNAIFPYRGYVCSAPNTWKPTTNGPGAQTTTQGYTDALTLLKQKVGYAHSRWGATMFYFDSNVWEGGVALDNSIFRTLSAQFPDCLFIPEIMNQSYFGSTAPYKRPAYDNYWATSAETRDLYPTAFSVINIADADWAGNQTTLVNAVKSGDILMFPGWFDTPEVQGIQTIYNAATQP